MANETVITVCGVLGQDPELRFTPAGKPVANLSIASTPSRYDRNTSQWTDGTTMWMRASAWGDMAENVAESLTRGARVVAVGRLEIREYETQQGYRRTSAEVTLDDIGPSLLFAPHHRANTPNQAAGAAGWPPQPQPSAASTPQDPWAQQTGGDDAPPF